MLNQSKELQSNTKNQNNLSELLRPITNYLGFDFKRWTKEHNHDEINSSSIEALKLRKVVDTAPTYIPKNLAEAIVRYDDGTDKKLYVYINGWVSVTLS